MDFAASAKVNEADYGTVGTCIVTVGTDLAAVSFGAYSSGVAAFDIRNVTVGTSGYGSGDIFAPVLNDLTEFTGVFGNDGSIAAASGVLSVDSSSDDHYGYFDLPTPRTGPATVYFQFDLRVRPGNTEPDYANIWDSAFPPSGDRLALDGIFDVGRVWKMDGCGDPIFGSGPSRAPFWDTLGLGFFLGSTPPPPAPAVHICS